MTPGPLLPSSVRPGVLGTLSSPPQPGLSLFFGPRASGAKPKPSLQAQEVGWGVRAALASVRAGLVGVGASSLPTRTPVAQPRCGRAHPPHGLGTPNAMRLLVCGSTSGSALSFEGQLPTWRPNQNQVAAGSCAPPPAGLCGEQACRGASPQTRVFSSHPRGGLAWLPSLVFIL